MSSEPAVPAGTRTRASTAAGTAAASTSADPGSPAARVATTPTGAKRLSQVSVQRFDRTERVVHWTTAILMLELLVTGAILYLPSIALRVGHRALVENIHVYSGLALLLPLVIGVLGPWRAHLVADLRRFDRWTRADWDWFHVKQKRSHLPAGKFNGGQKAEASFLGGSMVVMLVTGVLMRFAPSSWITWQQGATLVHDVGFLTVGVAVIGHIYMAMSRPEQLKSIFTGFIDRKWAVRNNPAWMAEVETEVADKP